MYLECGNMEDINNMSLTDFYGILRFSKKRQDKREGKPIPLKESQKEMIRRTREKNRKEK